MNDIFVLTCTAPDTYMVGFASSSTWRPDVTRLLRISDPAYLFVTPAEENQAPQLVFRPAGICKVQWVNVRHFLSVGFLEGEWAEKYCTWQKHYNSPTNLFKDDDDDPVEDVEEVEDT